MGVIQLAPVDTRILDRIHLPCDRRVISIIVMIMLQHPADPKEQDGAYRENLEGRLRDKATDSSCIVAIIGHGLIRFAIALDRRSLRTKALPVLLYV